MAKNASKSTMTIKSEKHTCQRSRRVAKEAAMAAIIAGINMNARRLFCLAITHQ